MNLQLGTSVWAVEIGRQGGHRLQGREGPGLRSPRKGLDCAGDLVDEIDPAPIGVEADVPRAGAGLDWDERRRIGRQAASRLVEAINEHFVDAEIWNQCESIRGI